MSNQISCQILTCINNLVRSPDGQLPASWVALVADQSSIFVEVALVADFVFLVGVRFGIGVGIDPDGYSACRYRGIVVS